MSLAAIAKEIRQDLKDHAITGDLPDLKYTVRVKDRKILVTVGSRPPFPIWQKRGRYIAYTDRAARLLDKVEAIMREYQQDVVEEGGTKPNFRPLALFDDTLKEIE